MASQHSGRRIPGPNDMKAARKYVRHYPDHAAQYIFDTCDPVQQLQLACANKGQSDEHYHRIMLQDSDPEDDTKSQSSRRRTMSSDYSALTSYSSDSGNGPPKQLWVMPGNGSKAPKTLTAQSLPQSDCLIGIDAVCGHLGIQYEPLSGVELVRYNEGHLSSSGTISIEWARKPSQLGTKQAQQNTFYVVDELPGTQVVFGDSEPEASPVDHPGGLPIGLNTQPNSYGNVPVTENSPGSLHRGHGARLQQPPYTSSFTEDSTTMTVKPFASRTGSVTKERQRSVTSEKSKIIKPKTSEKSKITKPKTSGSSVRSTFTNQSRAHDGRASQGTPTPPPPVAQVGLTSGLTVDISYGECEMGIELQLDAPGAEFYALLYREIKRKTKRKLNRQTDKVRFTRDKNDFLSCRWVSLEEHRVKTEWKNAANWLRKLEEGCDIYAVVGPEPDDDDDDDDPPD